MNAPIAPPAALFVSGAATPPRLLLPAGAAATLWARLGGPDALFGAKSTLSAALACWIALAIGLERPVWSVMTCLILAQPMAGAVLSKALFRLVGTLVGAAAAIVLVPNLVNVPEVLCAGLVLWIALCTYLALLDRTPRAYVFLLAGYTAAIIGFPAVSAPGGIFDLALVRVQEIGIGIVVSALVHGLILPRSVSAEVAGRADRMVTDAERLSAAILAGGPLAAHRGPRDTLVRDLAALDALSVHLPYDLTRLAVRRDLLHALQHRLADVLAMAGAVEDRLARLGADVPSAMAALLADVAAWLAGGEGSALRLVARAHAAEPRVVAAMPAALELSLADRLAQLIEAHCACRALRAALHRRDQAVPAALVSDIDLARRPGRHRDRAGALLGALATMIATLAGCALWIGLAWPEGGTAVVYATMICALFANLEAPGPAVRNVIYGVLIGTAGALLYRYTAMPRITTYPVLMLSLAPAFLIMSTMGQQPGGAGLAIGGMLAFPALVGIGRDYEPDFLSFANAAVAQLVGATLAATGLHIARGSSGAGRRRRLVAAARLALERRLAGRGEPGAQWAAAMLDRVGLLAGLPGETAPAVMAVLRMLRLGHAIDNLRAIPATGAADARRVALIERRVLQAVRRPGGHRQAQVALQRALPLLARDAPGAARRTAVLAVVALACNLDPVEG